MVLGFDIPLANAAGTARTIMSVFYYLFVLAFVGGTGYIFYRILWQYRHKVRIREIRGRTQYIQDDKLWIKKKNGMITWHLMKNKEQIPIAPDDCISLGQWGTKVIEAFRTETGQLTYINPIPEKKLKPFEPITTNQRIMYRSIYKKINQKRIESWKNNIPQIASIGVMGIVVVCLFVFWGNLAEPLLQMSSNQQAYQAGQTEQLKIMKDIKYGVQTIDGKIEGGAVVTPPD